MSNEPTILVAGLADPAHAADLQRMADEARRVIVLAAPLQVSGGRLAGATALDFTSYLEWEPVLEACRASARPGDLVLFREHQLRHEATAEAVRTLGLRAVALDADVSHDDVPARIAARIESLQKSTTMEAYALDLFTDVHASWDYFQREAGPDALGPAALRKIGERFPLVLSADVSAANIRQVASFPGVRGILLTCDEVAPSYPAHRHVSSFESISAALHALWGLSPILEASPSPSSP